MGPLNVRIALMILLLLSIGHIIFNVYLSESSRDAGTDEELFAQGVQQGYEQAVMQLAQQVATCEQVPLQIGDQSINVIAVECLQ